MASGQRYLEAHHIVALACDGPDTVENVVALCPNHHREAHFGVDAEKINDDPIMNRQGKSPRSTESAIENLGAKEGTQIHR